MNVLVTGGTGFVGREILRQLRIAGHRVHLLVRSPENRAVQQLAEQVGAKVRAGNVLDELSLRGAFEEMNGVIHLVGIISEFGEQTFENVHVRGTQNVVYAAQDAGVRRFLHMSALGTRPLARSRYHQTKWQAEERVRHSGLGWTLFRPSIIYGPGDGFVNLFARFIRCSPVVPIIGIGESKFQPVAVNVVATAFVKALTTDGAVGESCDLCGPETLTLDQIVDQISEVLGKRRMKLHLPLALVHSQAALLEAVFPRLLRRPPPLNRDQVLMLEEDNVGNGDPANQRFGLRHRAFREGIAEYLK